MPPDKPKPPLMLRWTMIVLSSATYVFAFGAGRVAS
jgi:hypothetical protein